MNRLGTKIHRESGRVGKTKKNEPLNVSACLYGTCEDAGKLNFKYLDLMTTRCDKNKSEKGFADVGAYTKWAEPQLNKEYKSVSVLA